MNSLYYKEEGNGPVLVMLHGFCETHEIWNEITPGLVTHFRVITPDLPGFGNSSGLTTSLTIKEVGRNVIRFLTSNGIQKCVLIGHSLGGYVALAVAEERQDLIAGLCLFHSTALPDTEEKKLNRDRVMDFVKKNGVLPFIEAFVPGLFFQKQPEHIERIYKIASKTTKNTVLDYTRAMRNRPDMTGFIRRSRKPILFIAGEKDTFITVSSLTEQTQLSGNCRLNVLAETGHMGMFEATEESIKILKDFSWACFHVTAP